MDERELTPAEEKHVLMNIFTLRRIERQPRGSINLNLMHITIVHSMTMNGDMNGGMNGGMDTPK